MYITNSSRTILIYEIFYVSICRPEPSSANSTEVQCSLYMRELQQVIARVYASYFAPYQCQEFIYDKYVYCHDFISIDIYARRL